MVAAEIFLPSSIRALTLGNASAQRRVTGHLLFRLDRSDNDRADDDVDDDDEAGSGRILKRKDELTPNATVRRNWYVNVKSSGAYA